MLKMIALVLMGFLLAFCAFKIYELGEIQTQVQKQSPVICMPIIGRSKGIGTLKMPNKTYVAFRGKRYTLLSSNKHFRNTAKLDSIDVSYDGKLDIAVLPDQKLNGPYFLLALIFLIGLFLILYPPIELYKAKKIPDLQN